MSDMPDIRKITKLFNTKATSINEADNTVVFRISDGKPDRQGEIVDQKSWDFTDYMQNPLLITSHDSSDIENGVGTAQELWYDAQDDSTYGRFKIDPTVSNKAQVAWNLVKAGILRTVSVGFISKDIEYTDDGTPVLKNNQLLETSLVLIPANPRAIALSFKEGSLSTKDARWLMDTMRKEADELDIQIKQSEEQESNGDSEKSMEEIKSQLSTLTEAMTKVAEALAARDDAANAQAEALAALTEKVEALTVQKAADETETDESDQDTDKVNEDAEESADKSTDVETTDDEQEDTEESGNADEVEKEGEESNDSDAAKDGENDQSGADADEFDEDAELTPELEAQIDEALEAASA